MTRNKRIRVIWFEYYIFFGLPNEPRVAEVGSREEGSLVPSRMALIPGAGGGEGQEIGRSPALKGAVRAERN